MTIFGVPCPPSTQRGGGGTSRVRALRTCRVEHPQNIAKHKAQRAGVALRKQIGRTGMRRKSSHFGNQKFDYKGLCPIITYRQRFQTTHRSSPNVGEVTITYGASPINSLHCYIASLFLKHYAVHIFDDLADRAVYECWPCNERSRHQTPSDMVSPQKRYERCPASDMLRLGFNKPHRKRIGTINV